MQMQVAESPHATYGLDPRGFLYVRLKRSQRDTLETAQINVDILRRLGGSAQKPLLVDVHLAGDLATNAREYYVKMCPLFANRMAIYSDSHLTRIIGNFFIAVVGNSSNAVPTRLFSDEPSAIGWLMA